MGNRHGHVLQHFAQAHGGAVDVVDAVVEVIDLPAALDLAADGVGHDAPVMLQDKGLHRQSVLRRLVDGGHVADAGHGHVERAGDGRRGEGQHVHALTQFLDMLLVGDAEALLLVHDEKPQVFEFHVLAEKPVRADHEVELAAGEIPQGLCCLGACAEAAQNPDLHREAEEPLQRRLVMLLGEHGGGYQDRGLFAVQYALHHRAKRDLRLAEAHVAAEEPVHGNRGLHIRLDLRDASQLIVCLRVAEVFLKLPLPLAVGGKGVAGKPLALGVEFY